VNVKDWIAQACAKEQDGAVKAVFPLPRVAPQFVLHQALVALPKKLFASVWI